MSRFFRRHQRIGNLLLTYERTKGALLYIRKSKAVETGSWDTSMKKLEIQYYQEITILGVIYTSTIARSGNVTWSRVSRGVKPLARDAYVRDLMSKTANPVRVYLLTLQDMAHSTDFPDPVRARQTTPSGNILVYIAWWCLQVASINLATAGGGRRYALIDVAAKCRTLFLVRFWAQRDRSGLLTVEWLNV
jgi:hypothetical protein